MVTQLKGGYNGRLPERSYLSVICILYPWLWQQRFQIITI